jgi:glycosyltransferase involved in cell wall biosynthesis
LTPADRAALRYWPGPSPTNSYHALLYGSASSAFDIAPGGPAAAARLAATRPSVFHLHWLSGIVGNAPDEPAAHANVTAFLDKIDTLRASGARLLWTIHNLVSHDCPWPDAEITLSRALVTRADAIHVHSARSLPEIATLYDLPAARVHVSAHGAYPEFSPDLTLSQAEARAPLDIASTAPVLLLPGLQRRYKGADRLLAALRDIWPDRPDLTLIVAGKTHGSPLADLVTPAESRCIRTVPGFLPPEDLTRLARAADAAVLPYARVLTSGSLLMALGLGLPVIAPAAGQIAEVMGTPPPGWLYPPTSDTPALTTAIRTMLADHAAARLPALGALARARAAVQPWPDLSPVIRAALA